MARPLLLDIVDYLVQTKLVQGDGVDTFRDIIPDNPDNIVALMEYQGSPAVYYETAVHRSVQINVRNKRANDARAKALDIYRALKLENAIVKFTADRWGQVTIRQTPFKLHTDDKGRTTYGFNVGITTTIE